VTQTPPHKGTISGNLSIGPYPARVRQSSLPTDALQGFPNLLATPCGEDARNILASHKSIHVLAIALRKRCDKYPSSENPTRLSENPRTSRRVLHPLLLSSIQNHGCMAELINVASSNSGPTMVGISLPQGPFSHSGAPQKGGIMLQVPRWAFVESSYACVQELINLQR